MTIKVEIDQAQLREILKKADPAHIKEDMHQLMKDAGHHGNTVAKQKIKGGTEQAGISMRFDVQPLEAKVYSVMPPARALSIEEGRRPGEDVPYMQAARHVTGRRYMTRRRLPELSKDEREQIDRFRGAVKAAGAKGKAFIDGAREAVEKDMPKMLAKVASKIEGRWSK
jgi:hypothetical protein